MDFNVRTLTSRVVDGVAVEVAATLGGSPLPPRSVDEGEFPATVEEVLGYFEGLVTAGGTVSITLDPNGWYPALAAADPDPAAIDDEFSWTMTVEP